MTDQIIRITQLYHNILEIGIILLGLVITFSLPIFIIFYLFDLEMKAKEDLSE